MNQPFYNLYKKEVTKKKFDPSVVSMSLDHHEEDLALKATVITDKNVLRLFMSLKSFSKSDKNKSNSLLFWQAKPQITDTYFFIVASHF